MTKADYVIFEYFLPLSISHGMKVKIIINLVSVSPCIVGFCFGCQLANKTEEQNIDNQ